VRRATFGAAAALLLLAGPSVAVATAADEAPAPSAVATSTLTDGSADDGAGPDDGTAPDDDGTTTPDDGSGQGADDGSGDDGSDGTGTDDGTGTTPDDGTGGTDGTGEDPGSASTARTLDDAVLAWGINTEVSSGAYFGGCNFLSAGTAGNTGSSRVWTQADGFYKAKDGAVSVRKAAAKGWATPTWATKCQGADGKEVDTSSSTGSQVVLSGGTGTVDPAAGTARITWKGTFSVVFYGGMTYWTATNPVLTVAADGTGTLVATGGGYGASRDGGVWNKLDPTTITLARLSGVTLTDKGFTRLPDYLGVSVKGAGQVEKSTDNAAYWGSFPQDFVDFQQLTGQSTYWLASGGAGDRRKVPTALTVSYDSADQVVVQPPADSGKKDKGKKNKKKSKAPKNTTKRPPSTSTPSTPATPSVPAPPATSPTAPAVPTAPLPAAPTGSPLPQTLPTTSATGYDQVSQGPVATTFALAPAAVPAAAAGAPSARSSMTARDVWLLGGALWLGAAAVAIGLPRAGTRRR